MRALGRRAGAVASRGGERAEIWDPKTEEFRLLSVTHQIPRSYHSTVLLLHDGRVWTGGGGLCGDCEVNHLDAELYSPPYLFNDDDTPAERPEITVSAAKAGYGAAVEVTSTHELGMVSFIRFGTATHSTNTDARRLELCGPDTVACATLWNGAAYALTMPESPGVAPPGYWMLFGVNTVGVPSVAETVQLVAGA